MINDIILMNSLGWATFPVIVSKDPKIDKSPACKNWTIREPAELLDIMVEEDDYIRAGAYGVVLRPQDLIIDIDPRNFVDGVNPWKKLLQDLKITKMTVPAVITGGGGVHIYLRKPRDIKLLVHLPGYLGMDIQSGGKGAYVVGPGSGHASGKHYRFHNEPAFRCIPNVPDVLLQVLLALPASPFQQGAGLTGGPQEYARYTKWLLTAPPAVEGEGGDITTFKAAVKGRDFGLVPADTLKAMVTTYNPRCRPQWSIEDLMLKIRNAYAYASGSAGKEDPALAFKPVNTPWDEEDDAVRGWDVDAKGNISKTLKNAIHYIYEDPKLNSTIKLNQFTGDVELVGKLPWGDKRSPGNTWTDSDIVLLKYYFAKVQKKAFSTPLLWDALHAVAVRFSYHPIREYVLGLKWDGILRLDSWLHKYCGANDSAYPAVVGRKLLVGMVARVFHPGVKFDYCLVLEGAQGIGKSTVCAVLGGKWYGDIILDPHARDTIDAMRGKWVVELSEMEVTKRADAQALKAFVSRTSDRARLAYARASLDFPRQCVFVGTINPDEMGYLTDSTGNRRFWPIKCGTRIDTTGLAEVKDQLFAEAYVAYQNKEELYLQGDLIKLAEIEQKSRTTVDPWLDAISEWLDETGVAEVTLAQVWELALAGLTRSLTRADQCRIGRALSDLGWVKHRPRRGGSRVHIYKQVEQLGLTTNIV